MNIYVHSEEMAVMSIVFGRHILETGKGRMTRNSEEAAKFIQSLKELIQSMSKE